MSRDKARGDGFGWARFGDKWQTIAAGLAPTREEALAKANEPT
jgi:hypothetical protein